MVHEYVVAWHFKESLHRYATMDVELLVGYNNHGMESMVGHDNYGMDV